MGKTIIQQARGHGSLSYQAKKRAFVFEIKYPKKLNGKIVVLNIINSRAHSAPLAKMKMKYTNAEGKNEEKMFYTPACNGLIVGQEINGSEVKDGDIRALKDVPVGKFIFNLESRPGDGGKMIRTAGSVGQLVGRTENGMMDILMPSKKRKLMHEDCKVTLGTIANAGRLEKPIIKAGKMHYIKKSRNKLWPRTSAVKFNAIDHPFGSGRGKRIKSKIAYKNAPAGRKVGILRPRRTGKQK